MWKDDGKEMFISRLGGVNGMQGEGAILATNGIVQENELERR